MPKRPPPRDELDATLAQHIKAEVAQDGVLSTPAPVSVGSALTVDQQILDAQVSGPLVTDAALAALAMEQGATLCSTDRDFRRFQGLKLVDPVQPVN